MIYWYPVKTFSRTTCQACTTGTLCRLAALVNSMAAQEYTLAQVHMCM